MPEMKRNFTGGRMNKDLDERIIPDGEYRDAVNMQVSTSEESNVGTAQNILGNKLGCNSSFDNDEFSVVGSVADEKNDSLYWMLASNFSNQIPLLPDDEFATPLTYTPTFIKDVIMRKTPEGCEPVLVDKYSFCVHHESVGLFDNIPIDPSLFSNITPGMTATGYNNNAGVQFGPINTTHVGLLTSVPLQYQGVPDAVYSQAEYNGEFSMLVNPNTVPPAWPFEGDCTLVENNVIFLNNFSGVLNNVNDLVNDELKLFPGTSNEQIFTITNASNYGIATQTEVQYSSGELTRYSLIKLTLDNNIILSPSVELENGNVFNTEENTVLNIIGDVELGGYGLTSTLTTSLNYLPEPIDGLITSSIVTTNYIQTNLVDVLTTSTAAILQLNSLLFDENGNLIPDVVLQIDNSLGAGSSWPANSCINAVTFGDSTALGPNADFEIVDCDDINTPIIPTDGGNGRPLTFTIIGSTTESVWLSRGVDLTNASTICFESEKVLSFDPNRLITGINIIDDMLFWTDNFTEPKKINIPRSVAGTDNVDTHTNLIVEGENKGPVREENVTVIRKGPKQSLTLDLSTGRDTALEYAGITTVTSGFVNDLNGNLVNQTEIIGSNNPAVVYNFSNLKVGDRVFFVIKTDIDGNDNFTLKWKQGDVLLLKEFNEDGTNDPVPLFHHTIRGRITNHQNTSFVSNPNLQDPNGAYGNIWPEARVGRAHVQIEILSLEEDRANPVQGETLNYVVDLELTEKPIFESKFTRFSYRYKYEDGEYSTFAPWSDVAFVPGGFNYRPEQGINAGMTNNVRSIKIKNFYTEDLPKDVTEIDILYKEETSPNIYLVETLSSRDGNEEKSWYNNEYVITSETIKGVLPSNQLLRPWDNVPTQALAQEITGNRLVYANYSQNYNLNDGFSSSKYKPNFKNYLTSWQGGNKTSGIKSIKSLRDYKLGVVFTDEYGRETPILVGKSGGFKVDKQDSIKANRLVASLSGSSPNSMRYFKFFIKETSTEYYNLAMDRWYEAEDGNIWISFPSSDRNKIDEETFLYLKKAYSDAVDNTTKYKILAISNEAPSFIKIKKVKIGTIKHDARVPVGVSTRDVLGPGLTNIPRIKQRSFSMNYFEGGFSATSLSHLDEISDDLYVNFRFGSFNSSQYKISQITSDRDNDTDPTAYHVSIDGTFDSDIGFIFDNIESPTKIKNGVEIEISRDMGVDSAVFLGKFFVKIANDGRIKLDIVDSTNGTNYMEVGSRKVFVLDDDLTLKDRSQQAWVLNADGTIGDLLNQFPQSEDFIDSEGNNEYYPTYFSDGNYPINMITHDYASISDGGSIEDNVINDNDHLQNPNGDNWNYYNARQCYFGKRQRPKDNLVPVNVGDVHSGQALPYGLGVKYPDDDGVWFIDRSTKKYKTWPSNNSLKWTSEGDFMNNFGPSVDDITDTNGPQDKVGTGIYSGPNSSRVNLGFGGISIFETSGQKLQRSPIYNGEDENIVDKVYYHMEGESQEEQVSNFFGIGEDNEAYSDPSTTDFVNRLYAGYSFKWKQDPTETVYTVVNQSTKEHNIRWSRHDDGFKFHRAALIESPSSYHKKWHFDVTPPMTWNPADLIDNPGGIDVCLRLGNQFFSTSNTIDAVNGATILTGVAEADMQKIKVGMTVKHANIPANTLVVSIDENSSFIVISNNVGAALTNVILDIGYTIRLQETSLDFTVNGNWGPNDYPYIVVDQIEAECKNNGNLYSLQKGMRLEKLGVKTIAQGNLSNNIIIKDIEALEVGFKISLTGYTEPLVPALMVTGNATVNAGNEVEFCQVTMNGVSNNTEFNTDLSKDYWETDTNGNATAGIGAVGYDMVMLEPEIEDVGITPDPYVWETEPKDNTDLDIYYEISENNPINLNSKTITTAIPIGSRVTSLEGEGWENYSANPDNVVVIANASVGGDIIEVSQAAWVSDATMQVAVRESGLGLLLKIPPLQPGSRISITKPNGMIFTAQISEVLKDNENDNIANKFRIASNLFNADYYLTWHNCYSFGNGVESNRVKDNFNLPFITNGVKASTTLDREYKKEFRKNGLIYSGIYNSNSGVNNLNQFIQAEKITKDINPSYGSIQKLHTRDTDLITLCEDKVLKILSNKDAVFNADGNLQLTASENVLGQAIPFVGEYGMSKNPESFASEAYRVYFTDKVRGSVMRLSRDGLTPISSHGMKDWFRDNLKLSNRLVGSYDDRKEEYNITLDNSVDNLPKTVSFKEDVKGWVSFKSFIPENAISCANEYYTFKNGNLWKHHDEGVDRNTFYNIHAPTSLNVILNDSPSVVKTFNTLNYEGSQSKVKIQTTYDIPDVTTWNGTFNVETGLPFYLSNNATLAYDGYYNLQDKDGWFVESIITDQEEGSINEFIEKEGKWFNYIKGKAW
tara:strand:- start:296 stop:7429 length:7134 start_codon:yes stop_codon:yes gene_type:complete